MSERPPRGARRVAGKGPVSEQLLQHPRRHAANGVADKIDRVRLVPLWEGTVALVTAEARVVAPAGVLSAVVDHAALERVEELASAVVVREASGCTRCSTMTGTWRSTTSAKAAGRGGSGCRRAGEPAFCEL